MSNLFLLAAALIITLHPVNGSSGSWSYPDDQHTREIRDAVHALSSYRYDPDDPVNSIILLAAGITVLYVGPMMLFAIGIAFAVSYVVLVRRNALYRRYMIAISSGILVYFGFSWFSTPLTNLIFGYGLANADPAVIAVSVLVQAGFGSALIMLGVFFLKKTAMRHRHRVLLVAGIGAFTMVSSVSYAIYAHNA